MNLLEYETARDPKQVDYSAPNIAPTTSQLVQGSIRMHAGTGDNIMIAGFIVQGDGPKRMVLRALGPSLPLSGRMADPQLRLFDKTGTAISYDDNWQEDTTQAQLLQQYGLSGGLDIQDSAMVVTLEPGSYTAQVSGVNDTTGIVLFEMYDVDSTSLNLVNLSARAQLQPGDNVLIAGFMISGQDPLKVMVRAAGPSLSRRGLSEVLPDPYLQLFRSDNQSNILVAANDNWRDSAQVADILASTIAPEDPLEAALVESLSPGIYTAVVSGSPNTPSTGIGLVEVFNLDAGQDSDDDGLTDWEENNIYHTRPDLKDTDGDQMDDSWEVAHGLDARHNDASSDKDGDGISNLAEYTAQSDPAHFDLPKGNTVGLTEGRLTVDNSGASHYSIPIVVSPGTAGIQPKLSFEYSSRAGNGALGVGWSIAGLSTITRAPQTRAQDGSVHGVDFTNQDRFSLDGQRLMVINGSEYGGNNAEYRTEINSFTKIISKTDQSGAGPRSFVAYTKSGLTYTYGESDESRFLAQGRSDNAVLSWALSRVSDSSGNSMLFHYSRNQTSGEYWIVSIEYTKNDSAGSGAYASVEFDYEATRPDQSKSYLAGSQLAQTHRLIGVTSLYGSEIVRHYKLTYEQSPSTQRSRIRQIQESAGGTRTLENHEGRAYFNPTTFEWSTDGDDLSSPGFRQSSSGTIKTQRWMAGDFNGDGRSDFARVSLDGTIGVFTVPENGASQSGFTQISNQAMTGAFNEDDKWLSGDYNGDGKLDILRIYKNTLASDNANTYLQLYANDGSGQLSLTGCTLAPSLAFPRSSFVYPADANGDGKLDLVVITGVSDEGATGRVKIFVLLNQGLSSGAVTFQTQVWFNQTSNDGLNFESSLKWFIGDTTGDGLPDLVVVKKNSDKCAVFVYVNKNGSYQRSIYRDSEGLVDTAVWLNGDFNGDGLMDLARLTKQSKQVTVYLASGQEGSAKQFSAQPWTDIGTVASSVDVHGGDFNGDGRSDIGIISRDSNIYDEYDGEGSTLPPQTYTYRQTTYLSNGVTGFWQGSSDVELETSLKYDFKTLEWLPADFNGDGKEDLARLYSIFGQLVVRVWTTSGIVHDLLTKATDGMNSFSSIHYTTLADSAVYPRTAPVESLPSAIDLVVPMSVVLTADYDDGVGGRYAINYQYHGLKANPLRGILGFRSITSTDTRTLIWNKTILRQDFPFTGMLAGAESHQGGNNLLLSTATAIYVDKTPNGPVHAPYAQRSTSQTYELDGMLTSETITTTDAMDDHGNATDITVASLDGYTKRTESSYEADEGKWHIGKLRSSTVTHSVPGRPDIVRASGFDYYSATSGQVRSETIEPGDADSASTTYDYDQFGNVHVATVSASDIQPRRTITNYDERGRLVKSTQNALDHVETRKYDERFGAVTIVTGPNQIATETVYDDFGRKRLERRGDGSRTIITYEWAPPDPARPAGAVYLVRSAPDGAAAVTSYFDRLGRELQKRTESAFDSEGHAKTVFADTTYNGLGQVETTSRPYFAGTTPMVTRRSYDLAGRVYRVETPREPINGTSAIAVAVNIYHGLSVDSINPLQYDLAHGQIQNALKTTTTKDSQGHVIQVTDAKGGTITYVYDAVGNLLQTEDAAHNVTTMTYDTRGRKKTMDDPDLGYWQYDYNSLGELVSHTDANGNFVSFTYDKLGRLEKRVEPEGESLWTYDNAAGKGIGKLATASFTPNSPGDAPYQRTLTYDALGRASTQKDRVAFSDYNLQTTYDEFSRVSTITYPGGFAVRNKYDSNGYLQQIERDDIPGVPYWQANAYDSDGHITQQRSGNGIVTDRAYVPETGVLREIKSTNGSNNLIVQKIDYAFDLIGNLTNRTDHMQTVNGVVLSETFDYDELNRLRHSTVEGQNTKEFQYDIVGNILRKDGADYRYIPADGSPGPAPGERLHPHAVRSIAGSADCVYDRNGNMTSGFNRTIDWTSFNAPRLIQRNSASSYFSYDPEHNRVTQLAQKGGSTVKTIYIAGIFEQEIIEGVSVDNRHYINAPTGRIAVYTEHVPLPNLLGEPTGPASNNTRYLHKDHLESTDAVTDESGAVVERDSFDAWGARREIDWRPAQGPIFSVLKRGFTGHEQLDDLGLVHMNGRVYDPAAGRFLSADPFTQAPMVSQNFNRYSYVLNNPLSFSDPTGFNIFGDFANWLTNTLGPTGAQIVIGVVAIAAGIATAGVFTAAYAAAMGVAVSSLAPLTSAIVAGAGFGFGSAFSSTLLSGASLGQALQAGLIGAVIGGISGGIAKGLGDLNPGGDFFSWGHAEQTLGHALLGGATGEVQGGNFGSGALAGAVNGAFGPTIDRIGNGSVTFECVAERVAIAAALGGTASILGGGKFANGAVTAAFLRLYNEEVHLRTRGISLHTVRMRVGPDIKDALAVVSINLDGSTTTDYYVWGYTGMEGAPLGDMILGTAAVGGLKLIGRVLVAEEEVVLYRVFGGKAPGVEGNWYTTVDPRTVANYREIAGLYPGNTGTHLLKGTLTDFKDVKFGFAAPGPGGIGGGLPEAFVPRPTLQINVTNIFELSPHY